MADWYYAKDGERQGPVSAAQLKQMAQAGTLLPTDMVFKEGGKEWIAASTVKDLFAGISSRSSSSAPARTEADAGSLSFGESGGGRGRAPDVSEDDSPRSSRRRSGGMGDILAFRKMIAPFFIMLLFWLGVLGAVLGGLGGAAFGFMQGMPMLMSVGIAVGALVGIPLAILYLRFMAEVCILTFRIHERLTEIRDLLHRQSR